MSDDYRDPLAAALSRIEALERENAALKDAQSGRPATAAELQAVRLDNELFRLDMQWQAEMQRRYPRARVDDAMLRRGRLTSIAVPALMIGFGFVTAFLVGHGALGTMGFAPFAVMAALLFGTMRYSLARMAREHGQHAKARAQLVQEIAKLRGTAGPADGEVAPPRARVAQLDEVPASDEAAPPLRAQEK